MNEKELNTYEKLRLHLDKLPIGYPETKTGVEMRILKRLFTPEQAEIALALGFFPDNLKKLKRKLKKYSLEELEQKLDEMYFEGLINRGIRNENGEDVKYYTLAPLAIGMYEYQLNKLTPELY